MSTNTLIYIAFSFFLFLSCVKISYKLKLVDKPNNRKIHTKSVAYTGGIAISIILIFSILLFNLTDKHLNNILAFGLLISLVGFIDDLYDINVGSKLSLQVFPIFYLISFSNLFLSNLGDYEIFTVSLGSFGPIFSLLSVIFLINSFNYFDGMDGTLGFASISIILILYFLSTKEHTELYLKIIVIPIAIFLIFNFSMFKLPKIFLGDSGSLLIGFLISFTLIYFANNKIAHPILLAWSVSIFVYEFLSLNLIRLIKKKRIFQPGKDHLHHILFFKFKSLLFTNIFIFILNILLFIIGYFSFLMNSLFSLILFLFLFIVYFFLRNKFKVIINKT